MTASPETPAPGQAAADPSPLLSLRGIDKCFGAVQVLRGVDLDVFPGR